MAFLAIMCSLLYLRFVLFVGRAMCFYFISSVPSEQRGGGGGGCQTSPFCSLFSVQQTTSGIGHYCVKSSSVVGLAANTLNLRNNIVLNIERYSSIQKGVHLLLIDTYYNNRWWSNFSPEWSIVVVVTSQITIMPGSAE